MAVMKASRGVTRPSRPHSEAMVSSAFRMFSVAVSSVLKRQDKRKRHKEKRKVKSVVCYSYYICSILLYLSAEIFFIPYQHVLWH